uniref:Uncharacterized protein n=1 Tax=Raphanus sativus TaxID=3726 RepID=A0A650GBS3_RAPSA|nr:hypothetical protein [Raphanus sativus]
MQHEKELFTLRFNRMNEVRGSSASPCNPRNQTGSYQLIPPCLGIPIERRDRFNRGVLPASLKKLGSSAPWLIEGPMPLKLKSI